MIVLERDLLLQQPAKVSQISQVRTGAIHKTMIDMGIKGDDPRAEFGWAATNGHILSAGGDAVICCFKFHRASNHA